MRYTDEEMINIKTDYKNGMTPKEIGEKYHRSAKAIDSKLRNMGVLKRGIKIYNFSEEDIEFLKNEYPQGNWDLITKRFPNVPRQRIYSLMSKYGIQMSSYFWSEHDKMILKQYYGDLTTKEIQSMLDKKYSINLIQNQAKKMGLTQSMCWNKDELNILCNNYENTDIKDICKLIPDKSENAISLKARSVGLSSHWAQEHCYTKEEDEFIYNNYATMSNKELADNIGRTVGSVKGRKRMLGLVRPKLDRKYYDIQDYIRHNNESWKKKSMESCNYKCIFTQSSDFEVHHKYSFNLILKEAMEDKRWIIKDIKEYADNELKLLLDIFNEYQYKYPLGICISKEIHMLFHSIYGNRHNTEQQWDDFERNYKLKLIA